MCFELAQRFTPLPRFTKGSRLPGESRQKFDKPIWLRFNGRVGLPLR
jgi:hypothetical protein